MIGLTIKAILFDVGNTLIEYDVEFFEEVFQRILTSLSITRSLDDIKKAFLNAENESRNLHLLSSFGKVKCQEHWNTWDSLVLKHLEIADHEELGKAIHSMWFDFVKCAPYPEVKEVLSELRQRGMKIGLISNGYEEEIQIILQKANLERAAFDIVIGVDTIKKGKPNPDIFRYAISKLDVKPEEAMFVGDDVEADYMGARNAGIHALLIDRTEKQQSDFKTIRNLTDVLILIGETARIKQV